MHSKKVCAVPEIFHLKACVDELFESVCVASHDAQVVYLDVYEARPLRISGYEETGIGGGWCEFDGEKERSKLVIPTAWRLLQSVQGFLKHENNVFAFGLAFVALRDFDVYGFFWYAIEKGANRIHLDNFKVF